MFHTTATQQPSGYDMKHKCNTPSVRTDILNKKQLGIWIAIAKAIPNLRDMHDIVVIVSNTGIRFGELASLCWPQVDLQKRQLTVRAKRSGMRIVPFGPRTRFVLEARQKRASRSECALGDAPHSTLARIRHQLSLLGAQVGVRRLNLYMPRRTFACRFVAAGGSLHTLLAICGWKSSRRFGRVLRSRRFSFRRWLVNKH